MASYLTSHREEFAPKTTGRKKTAFAAFCQWGGYAEGMARYRAPTPAKPLPHPLPGGMDDVTDMLTACRARPHHAGLIALCGHVGVRVGEAIGVRARDVTLATRTLLVPATVAKGGRERSLPLSATAWRYLTPVIGMALEEGDDRLIPWSDSYARRTITMLGVRAGIRRPVSSHDLRATFATHLYNECLDLRAVQEYLGHADSKTTQVYTEVNQSALRSLVEAAFDPAPAQISVVPDADEQPMGKLLQFRRPA